MKRSYSAQLNVIAVGQANILAVGVPSGKTWTLLEVRVPADVIALCTITVTMNGIAQHVLIPTFNMQDYVIGDALVGPVDIVCHYTKADVVAQNIGVTLVFDDGE